MPEAMQKCYPSGRSTVLTAAGYVLLALGILLLFVCIPCWAWLALLGVGLMVLGWVLLKLSNTWR